MSIKFPLCSYVLDYPYYIIPIHNNTQLYTSKSKRVNFMLTVENLKIKLFFNTIKKGQVLEVRLMY